MVQASLGEWCCLVMRPDRGGPDWHPHGPIIGEVVDQFNDAYTLSTTIEPYIYSFVSTDSHDKLANRILSEYEQISLPMQNLDVQLKAWLGKVATSLEASLEHSASAGVMTRLEAYKNVIENSRRRIDPQAICSAE